MALAAANDDANDERTPGDGPRTDEVSVGTAGPAWTLVSEGFDPQRERADESLFTVGDGQLGTNGAPLVDEASARPSVLMAGLYDGGGPETHLAVLPWVATADATRAPGGAIRRSLDLRAGVLYESVDTGAGELRSWRFSSLAHPGTLAVRMVLPAGSSRGPAPRIIAETKDDERGISGEVSWARVRAGAGGGLVAVVDDVSPGVDGVVVDRIAVYEGDPERSPEPQGAVQCVRQRAARGFDALLDEHRRAWAARWNDADIVIEGDDELQRAVRFSLFHLMASVPDVGEAPVGARGLSGPGYRGHVFWDADTFALPFLAATHPAAARAMLEYRLRRLPEAMEIARRSGRRGARFPWESAHSGCDVTPSSARDRTGRLVPIRTGLLEDHIVAEVAWAAHCYVDWTGDDEFAHGPGVDLMVETARYWMSRCRVDRHGTAHLYGVIGPDEYHEPVDDNAFTNVMARWNLRAAAASVERAPGGDAATPASADEIAHWRQLADALTDGFDPDTGIYEQCAGFHTLEPLIIEEIAPRRPIAADLLLGAERVRGSQVIKQADVLMLHHLVPGEVVPGSLEPNLRFYEPRTAHGSSLSPGIHASLFARARDYDHALENLRIAARLDLDDLTGTTSGGLHIATMGGLWQALVFGFAGMRAGSHALRVDPRLPPAWAGLEVHVRYHGAAVGMRVEHDQLTVRADRPVPVSIDGVVHRTGPRPLELNRVGAKWKVTR